MLTQPVTTEARIINMKKINDVLFMVSPYYRVFSFLVGYDDDLPSIVVPVGKLELLVFQP